MHEGVVIFITNFAGLPIPAVGFEMPRTETPQAQFVVHCLLEPILGL